MHENSHSQLSLGEKRLTWFQNYIFSGRSELYKYTTLSRMYSCNLGVDSYSFDGTETKEVSSNILLNQFLAMSVCFKILMLITVVSSHTLSEYIEQNSTHFTSSTGEKRAVICANLDQYKPKINTWKSMSNSIITLIGWRSMQGHHICKSSATLALLHQISTLSLYQWAFTLHVIWPAAYPLRGYQTLWPLQGALPFIIC